MTVMQLNMLCRNYLNLKIVFLFFFRSLNNSGLSSKDSSSLKMPSTCVKISETEVMKLVLEFLTSRHLNISMLSLERETGVINGLYSDDMLFLRQLILDGQWDDVLDFAQPLSTIESFNWKNFQYLIYRHKYLELLCIKSESGQSQSYELTVEELVKCVNQLEKFCPTKENYSNLCLLLTLPRLQDHTEYQNWNPSNARVECFKDIHPIVEKFLPIDKRDMKNDGQCLVSQNDRLVQLLVKGILYESCVEFCQQRATTADLDNDNLKLSSLLTGSVINDNDVSLISWLQALPYETFNCPFEKKRLAIDVQTLDKPSLEASWSEQILATPIKPKKFPHSAIFRPRSADIMSRSLMPQYDGLAYGLSKTGAERLSYPSDFMSKSFSNHSFHLNLGYKSKMQTSIDKMFDDSNILDTQSSIIIESTPVKSETLLINDDTPSGSPRSVTKTSTPVSTESDSNIVSPKPSESPRRSVTTPVSIMKKHSQSGETNDASLRTSSTDLYQQYQKQRQKLEVIHEGHGEGRIRNWALVSSG